MIVDTHTHLYLDDFESPDEAVDRAIAAGVGHMILPNVGIETVEPMLALNRRFPDNTSVALGLHPTEVDANWQSNLRTLRDMFQSTHGVVAVGEVGIDLYWDTAWREQQIEAFAQQVQWSLDLNLPLIIHCRDGVDEVVDVLKSFPTQPRAVMHSFTGTSDDIDRIRAVSPEMYFGINGIVTFKKSHLPDLLPVIGVERLLLETDSPYLAPVPMRGRRNESSYIVHTARFIAESLNMPVERLVDITTANARRLFSL